MGNGIDYGMGRTNIDTNTGIRFGVIPLHALSEYAIESFEADYGEPTCGKCGNELQEYDHEKHGDYPEISGCCDYACETCEKVYDSSDCLPDEPCGHYCDTDGHKMQLDDHNDIFVIESPYYTRAAFCSPCAPGACYLTDYRKGGAKAYCPAPDFFQDGKAPFPIWSVADNSLVYSPENA